MELALAVDVGGTKVAVGVVDAAGRLRRTASIPTAPRSHGADLADVGPDEALFARLAALLDTFAPFDQYRCCGVGCAGPMTQGGELVSPLNISAFRSFPLAARLADVTGLPCRVDNDAKALALAEGWVGSAVGVDDYLAMVVSTGVGGGIVLNGKLLDGAAGNAGHIGQMVVAWPGRSIDGHVAGTLEAEASGTAMAVHGGHSASEATTAALAEAATFVGRAAGSVVNLLDLRAVVVAGSVALGLGEPFFTAAQREMDRICTLDYSRGVRIQPAGCGAAGPLIGAAAVGFRSVGIDVGPGSPQQR